MSTIVFVSSDFALFTTLRTISSFITKSLSLARLKPVSIWRLPTNKIDFRDLQKALYTVTKPNQTTNRTNAAQQENLPKAWKSKPVWKPPKTRHAFPHAKRSQFELDRERSENITRHLEGKAQMLWIKREKDQDMGLQNPSPSGSNSLIRKALGLNYLTCLRRAFSTGKKFWGSWGKKKINMLLSQQLTISEGIFYSNSSHSGDRMPLPEPLPPCTGAGNTVHPSAQWTTPRHLCPILKPLKTPLKSPMLEQPH